MGSITATAYIGQGGHLTYESLDDDGAKIVVKTIGPHAGEDALDRLAHEATVLARLGHLAGIVRQRRYDAVAGVLVTERACGESLFVLSDAGALRRRDAWRVLLPLVRTIRQLHAQGVVHRDIAPGNIIFDRETGCVVLCDFGQACDRRAPTRFEREWRDVEVGTPAFRSWWLARNPSAKAAWLDYYAVARVGVWLFTNTSKPE